MISRSPWPALALLASLAIASSPLPASAQLGGVGGFQMTCADPTAEQCMDTAWLDTSCGHQRREACAPLYSAAANNFVAPTTLAHVPSDFSQSGIGYTRRDPRPLAPFQVVPDPASYSSVELALAYAPSSGSGSPLGVGGAFGIDTHALWAANGDVVTSCDEYVYEKFYGLTRYLRHVGPARGDFRHMVNQAFASTSEHWAIGTRHEGFGTGRLIAGFDGQTAGAMWVGQNAEFGFAPPRHIMMGTLPALLDATIRHAHFAGRHALVQLATIPPQKRQRPQSWSVQRWLNENLSYEGRPPANGLGSIATMPHPQSAFDVPPNDVDTLGSLLGSDWDAGVQRRYLDDELNAWFVELQRYATLIEEWRDLDRQYAGSGWTPEMLGPPATGPGREGGGFTARTPSGDRAASGSTTVGTGMMAVSGATLSLPSPESAARRRIAMEMGTLLNKARGAGCLSGDWLGPCDWSPAAFANRMMNHFSAQMDQRSSACNSFVASFGASHLNAVTGAVVSYTPPAELPSRDRAALTCHVQAPSQFTRASLESFMSAAGACRRKAERGEALAQQLGDALEALRTADSSAFFDNGELRDTHWQSTATETLGGENFGVELRYDIGYGIQRDPSHQLGSPSVCGSRVYARSVTEVVAKVRSIERNLLSVNGIFDTRAETPEASLSASIGDHVAYNSPLSVGEGGAMNWNLVDVGGSWDKTQKIVQFTFWIGPVPVGIEAGISGRVGVEINVNAGVNVAGGSTCLEGQLRTEVRPLVAVSGYLFAGVDIIVAKAGIRGFLTLVELGLPLSSQLTLGLGQQGNALAVDLTSQTRLGLDLTLLSGRLEVFVSAFGKDWSRTLVSWPGIRRSRTLFDHSYTVDLVQLHDAFAAAGAL